MCIELDNLIDYVKEAESSLYRHGIMYGQTGSGMTSTLQFNCIKMDQSVIVIEPKQEDRIMTVDLGMQIKGDE